jgi:hypothetical protein
MSIIRFVFAALMIFAIFNACRKRDLPNDSGKLLQKIINKSGDSLLYTFFSYDGQNRLTTITDSNNNGHLWNTFIEYNALERPVKFKVFYRNNPNGSFTEYSDSLLYNDNNQVVEKLSLYPSFPNMVRNTYSYDTHGRLTIDSGYSYWGNGVSAGYTGFTYDGNSNIVQWQTFYMLSSGEINSGGIITASYNMENNAYNSLGLAAYFIRGDEFLLSKQNATQIRYYDGTTRSYQYEYYSNGLPEKAVITNNTGGPFSVTSIEFFYY